MKKAIKILCLLLTTVSFAQNFEGQLEYEVSYDFTPSSSINQKTFFQKLGNYKKRIDAYKHDMMTSESENLNSFYYGKTKKYYVVDSAQRVVYESLMLKLDVPVQKIEKSTDKVLGKSTEKVVFKAEGAKIEYFFVKGFLSMDAQLYEGLTQDYFYEALKKYNCLPVKIVLTTEDGMIKTTTLVKIKEQELDYTVFVLPKMTKNDELTKKYGFEIFQFDELTSLDKIRGKDFLGLNPAKNQQIYDLLNYPKEGFSNTLQGLTFTLLTKTDCTTEYKKGIFWVVAVDGFENTEIVWEAIEQWANSFEHDPTAYNQVFFMSKKIKLEKKETLNEYAKYLLKDKKVQKYSLAVFEHQHGKGVLLKQKTNY